MPPVDPKPRWDLCGLATPPISADLHAVEEGAQHGVVRVQLTAAESAGVLLQGAEVRQRGGRGSAQVVAVEPQLTCPRLLYHLR